jgi:hypothetical protein
MIISRYENGNKLAEIHQENSHYLVKLYSNGRLIEVKDLSGHSIHYAESLAENFVESIGQTTQFLQD